MDRLRVVRAVDPHVFLNAHDALSQALALCQKNQLLRISAEMRRIESENAPALTTAKKLASAYGGELLYANFLRRSHRWTELSSAAERLRKLDATRWEGAYLLAFAKLKTGDNSQQEQLFREAGRLAPPNSHQAQIIEAYLRKMQYEQRRAPITWAISGRQFATAVSLIDEVTAKFPEKNELKLIRGSCLMEVSRFAEARTTLKGVKSPTKGESQTITALHRQIDAREQGAKIRDTAFLKRGISFGGISQPSVMEWLSAAARQADLPRLISVSDTGTRACMIFGANGWFQQGLSTTECLMIKSINTKRATIDSIAVGGADEIVILYDQGGYSCLHSNEALLKRLKESNTKKENIRGIGLAQGQRYAFVRERNGYSWGGACKEFGEALENLNARKRKIEFCAFAPNDGYLIVFDDYGYSSRNLPKEAEGRLKFLNGIKVPIYSASFLADGGWIITSGTH